jgi:hypothetical protein
MQERWIEQEADHAGECRESESGLFADRRGGYGEAMLSSESTVWTT